MPVGQRCFSSFSIVDYKLFFCASFVQLPPQRSGPALLPPLPPSTAHAPPPPALPPVCPGGASMRGELLKSTIKEKKLKKVERDAGGGGGISELLAAIQKVKMLRTEVTISL